MKFIILFSAILIVNEAAKFPSNWKKCPKKSNEECLKREVQLALKDLMNGKKSLGMLPLEPLHFSRMEMNQGGKSPVNINLTFFELDLIGISKAVINTIDIDWDKGVLQSDFDVVGGPITLFGDYNINGKVLVLPIQGKGKANITLENLSAFLQLKGVHELRNNKKYLNLNDGKLIIRSSRVHFYLGNLFDGVPNLGENMNKFLNENWKEIIGELNGTISNAMGLGFKEVANSVFKKIPLNELYTE